EGGGETREGDTLPLDGKALGALRFLPRAEAGLDAVSEHDPIDGISTAEQGEQQEQHENLAAHARVISGWACAVDAKAQGGNARDALAGARPPQILGGLSRVTRRMLPIPPFAGAA